MTRFAVRIWVGLRGSFLPALLLAAGSVRADEPSGWVDVGNDRRLVPMTKPLWRADFTRGISGFSVERRGGAEGEVSVTNGALRIVKTNDRGEIAVKGVAFPLAKGRKVRACARVACDTATPLRSTALLKVVGPKEFSGLSGLDRRNFGAKGPRVGGLVCTPPGTTETKFGHYEAWGEEGVATPLIVVGGPRSTSVWSDWAVESVDAAATDWKASVGRGRPRDRRAEATNETAFARQLAAEREHTAKVASVGGVPRLLVDGCVTAPVLYKGRHVGFKYLRGAYPYAGRRMEDEGDVRLQVAYVAGGRTPNYPQGFWTRDGYDARGAVESVRTAMRLAPQSLFVLSVSLVPYPTFGAEHPDECWRDRDGQFVYGNESVVYGAAKTLAEIPSNRWAWISYSSPSFRRAAKANVAALVAELKRTGLAKHIVGIHTCGFCDWQFATSNVPDESETARRAHRERGGGRDSVAFQQAEPTVLQNEISRFAKRCFGKDIVAFRWCFSAFSGEYAGSYDIGAFCESDALDILVAQPMYVNRAPGVPLGLRLPTASFALHGKLFVNEFDLRTDRTLEQCGDSEADAVGLGAAKGPDMWRSVYRRAAGQMIARDSGWWFYDMAGGWYDDPTIAADIAASVGTYKRILATKPGDWRPTAAVLIDEQGSLAAVAKRGRGRDFNAYHATLAASGVPCETYLAEDFLREPVRADAFRAIVWFGLGEADGRRQALLDRMRGRGVRVVLPDELEKATADDLHRVARTAGAYVPCAETGLQVDMNDRFVSVHCLCPGTYEFRLPFAAHVRNVKTGRIETVRGRTLSLDMVAGETRWYEFERE